MELKTYVNGEWIDGVWRETKTVTGTMDDSKPSEWIGIPVKQVRLIYGTELPRLQSDMNQELLALTLAHNQIESIRTYPFVQLNTLRYVGEITYSTPYMKVPKEDTPENK